MLVLEPALEVQQEPAPEPPLVAHTVLVQEQVLVVQLEQVQVHEREVSLEVLQVLVQVQDMELGQGQQPVQELVVCNKWVL